MEPANSQHSADNARLRRSHLRREARERSDRDAEEDAGPLWQQELVAALSLPRPEGQGGARMPPRPPVIVQSGNQTAYLGGPSQYFQHTTAPRQASATSIRSAPNSRPGVYIPRQSSASSTASAPNPNITSPAQQLQQVQDLLSHERMQHVRMQNQQELQRLTRIAQAGRAQEMCQREYERSTEQLEALRLQSARPPPIPLSGQQGWSGPSMPQAGQQRVRLPDSLQAQDQFLDQMRLQGNLAAAIAAGHRPRPPSGPRPTQFTPSRAAHAPSLGDPRPGAPSLGAPSLGAPSLGAPSLGAPRLAAFGPSGSTLTGISVPLPTPNPHQGSPSELTPLLSISQLHENYKDPFANALENRRIHSQPIDRSSSATVLGLNELENVILADQKLCHATCEVMLTQIAIAFIELDAGHEVATWNLPAPKSAEGWFDLVLKVDWSLRWVTTEATAAQKTTAWHECINSIREGIGCLREWNKVMPRGMWMTLQAQHREANRGVRSMAGERTEGRMEGAGTLRKRNDEESHRRPAARESAATAREVESREGRTEKERKDRKNLEQQSLEQRRQDIATTARETTTREKPERDSRPEAGVDSKIPEKVSAAQERGDPEPARQRPAPAAGDSNLADLRTRALQERDKREAAERRRSQSESLRRAKFPPDKEQRDKFRSERPQREKARYEASKRGKVDVERAQHQTVRSRST